MMKKICYIAFIAFAATMIASSLFAAEEGQITVTITGLEGAVLVRIPPSTEWVAAKVGQILQKGDEIKTLADGTAHLKLNDKLGFSLKPNSGFTVELPLVAEPYTEAGPAGAEPVYAPNAVSEPAASKT